jgi:hypothetical protein
MLPPWLAIEVCFSAQVNGRIPSVRLLENYGSHIRYCSVSRLATLPKSLIELQDFLHSGWIVGHLEAIANHDLSCWLAAHPSSSNQNGKAGIAHLKTEVT